MPALPLLGALVGAAIASWLLRRRRIALPKPARDPDEAALREAFAGCFGDRAAAEALWKKHALSVLLALRSAGRPCDDLVAAMLAVAKSFNAEDAEETRRSRSSFLEKETNPPRPPRLFSASSALKLFDDDAGQRRAATLALARRLDQRLRTEGRAAPEKPLSPAAQLDFAAGIALHDEAVEAAHRKLPEAHALVLASLGRLEAALGKDDPLLVPSLANAARAHSANGDRAAAEEALLRAIALHEAQPGADEGEGLRLHRLLEHVRAGA